MRRQRWSWAGAGSATPVDRLVDAAESIVTVGVRELVCQLANDCRSMARARTALVSAAGVKMSEEKLRVLAENDGKSMLRASASEQLELDWSAGQCKVTTPAEVEVSRIYAMADGVMIPVTTQSEKNKRRATVRARRLAYPARTGVRRPRLEPVKTGADQRYKQFFVTTMQDDEQRRRLVGVTRGDHRRLGKLLRRESVRVRLRGADQRVGLVDGAICLRRHMEGLPLTALGLDFYHLGEHVHAGKRGTFGETSDAGDRWAGEVLHTVRHEGYELFWDKLTEWRGRLSGKAKRKSANGLMHYAAERKDMICYKELEAEGCLIGTGPQESMCKVLSQRVKGPGMRWDSDNAEAMMEMEGLGQSNLWDQYWTKALQAVTYGTTRSVPG